MFVDVLKELFGPSVLEGVEGRNIRKCNQKCLDTRKTYLAKVKTIPKEKARTSYNVCKFCFATQKRPYLVICY